MGTRATNKRKRPSTKTVLGSDTTSYCVKTLSYPVIRQKVQLHIGASGQGVCYVVCFCFFLHVVARCQTHRDFRCV